MNSRLAHNMAVQDDSTEAAISYDGLVKPVDIATWHLDNVSVSDALAYAKEHDDEIKEDVDELAVHERGGDNIGYVTIEDGEIVGHTIYAQYQH